MMIFALAIIVCVSVFVFIQEVKGHAYLSVPISRNAVGSIDRGYCTWGGDIPCHGCPHCWNTEEPTSGCGIMQGGGGPYVYGSGALSFANTGVKTTYTQGQVMDIEVIISTYHGGKFSFYIQDVGSDSDPDGTLWSSLDPLIIESHSPQCDQGAEAPYGCAADPCRDDNTCMYIPLQPYGEHNYFYTMRVKLPDDLICEHCVLQWWWLTSNSCPGDYIACEGSEEFWNCADLAIVSNGSGPVDDDDVSPEEPNSCAHDEVGDAVCSGHGVSDCSAAATEAATTCWRPVWLWPNDYCEKQDRSCQQWELDQGGGSWQSCCEWNDHCKGTGVLEPASTIVQCSGVCSCFEGWSGDTCNVCTATPSASATPTIATTAAATATPSLLPATTSPTAAVVVTTTAPPTMAPTDLPPTEISVPLTAAPTQSLPPEYECSGQCYSSVNTAWYSPLVDAWCQLDCDTMTAQFPDRCFVGCRTDVRRLLYQDGGSSVWNSLRGLLFTDKATAVVPIDSTLLRGSASSSD